MPTPPPRLVPNFLYGTAWKEDRTAGLVEQAIRAGFRAIDTANQRRHYFEEGAGQGLAAAYRAGIVTRDALFLQTKFTYQRGQDLRLPYDPAASLSVQVAQSIASSLEHLATGYVDSFVLHGPSSAYGWTSEDEEVWDAMRAQRNAGYSRWLGVSNVSLLHLERMTTAAAELPSFVQNRCYARLGWDREVRAFCRRNNIVYQGFSLLTANQDVLGHPRLAQISARAQVTPAQVVFSFARAVGMLPITGTTDAHHMRQDLASCSIALSETEIHDLEALAG
jgi:diketogulonate reductase-like aldo/keto reductase